MNKCPCIDCIVLALCINSETVRESLEKCELISDYMETYSKATEVIKILKPRWFIARTGDVKMEAGHLLDLIRRKKMMKEMKETHV